MKRPLQLAHHGIRDIPHPQLIVFAHAHRTHGVHVIFLVVVVVHKYGVHRGGYVICLGTAPASFCGGVVGKPVVHRGQTGRLTKVGGIDVGSVGLAVALTVVGAGLE